MSPRLTRRQFLAGTVASGVALGSPKLFASPKLKSLTDQVKLGNTGIKASYLGFGTGTKGVGRESNQTRLGIVKFSRMINHAFDQGINYFDAADYYGTHEYLRSALKRIPREKYVLGSKIWYRTSKSAQEDLDRFLRELGTDYIDILFIHCVTEPSWAADLREMVEVLEAAKQKGIIRAHGISIHNLDVLKGVPDNPWVDICLARINPVGPFMDGRPDEVVPVLKKIHDAGKAVTGIKILGEGRIADQREKSMRYVLGLECVDSIVIGFESCNQIDDILAIGRRILA
ncbi:MAG TPA: aldo/keto reductase [Armatimonadota bacterium]|nr:aldo/keto reductase [Armatimonadota bacterium]